MTLSQAKIDLAVLLKLFQHGEANGKPEGAREISELFGVEITFHRITAALDALEARGEVVREHDRYKDDEYSRRISSAGIRTVEKALRVPTSFIARLNSSGDNWLESDEAQKAKLSKNPRYNDVDLKRPPFPMPIPRSEPHFETQLAVVQLSNPNRSIDWGKWGALAGILAIPLPILLWWFT